MQIHKEDNIFAAFVGNGNYKDDLIDMAKKLGLKEESYHFFDPIDKKQIPSLIEMCDASYVGALNNKMFRFGIGMNKLFDSMMGGKPILYSVKAPNNLIKKHECGISVKPEDEEALAEGLNILLSLTTDERKTMGENGRKAVLENYNYPILARQFLDFVIS